MTTGAGAGVTTVESVPLRFSLDLSVLRTRLKELAETVGLGEITTTRLLTAASELGRNCLVHGGGGTADIEVLDQGGTAGIRLTVRDAGPGIADVELAMTQGWTTGRGLGLGLPGSRRLADAFELDSIVGTGTTARVLFWSSR